MFGFAAFQPGKDAKSGLVGSYVVLVGFSDKSHVNATHLETSPASMSARSRDMRSCGGGSTSFGCGRSLSRKFSRSIRACSESSMMGSNRSLHSAFSLSFRSHARSKSRICLGLEELIL